MAPYSLTDYAIQALGYLATMHSTKVYKLNSEGKVVKKSNLWSAYNVRKYVDVLGIPSKYRSWYKEDKESKSS